MVQSTRSGERNKTDWRRRSVCERSTRCLSPAMARTCPTFPINKMLPLQLCLSRSVSLMRELLLAFYVSLQPRAPKNNTAAHGNKIKIEIVERGVPKKQWFLIKWMVEESQASEEGDSVVLFEEDLKQSNEV